FAEEKILKKRFRNELAKNHQWLRSKESSFIRNSNNLLNRLINSHLYFDEDGELNAETYQSGAFEKYKNDYLISKKESWENGVFHVNDTFCLSQNYFNFDSVRRRLQVRFKRSEEHTSELQSRFDLVCRLLLEKKRENTT